MKAKHIHLICIGLILLVALACYINCLPNEMFWDDDDFIIKNRFIKDWHYFPRFFSDNLVAGGFLLSNYWRPVLLTVFSLEWHAWNNLVYGWHLVNILIHAAAGMALYFLINRLFGMTALAIGVALIFTAHPVHNEAIVYVNSLGDSLSTAFVLTSLLFYARFRQKGGPAFTSPSYYASVLLYPVALMSKETGIVLVALLALMDFLILQNHKAFVIRLKNVAAAIWPFVAIAAVYLFLRGTVLNFANSFNFYNTEHNPFTDHISVRLMTFFKVLVQYTGFLFFPHELRVERTMPWATSFFQWDVMLGCLIFSGMLFSIFYFWKKAPWMSFGFAWFFAAIAPTSNVLVPINAVLYEHFLYVPMIGITLVCVYALLERTPKSSYPTLAKICVVIVLLFSFVNLRRNMDWRTAIGFYEQLVQYAPSYRVVNNLGMEYANKGFHDKALVWYKKAIEMDPNNAVAYHNYAGTLRDTGHVDEAIAAFQKAIALQPNFVFSYKSLAEIYYNKGNYTLSSQYLHAALSITPEDQAIIEAIKLVDSKK